MKNALQHCSTTRLAESEAVNGKGNILNTSWDDVKSNRGSMRKIPSMNGSTKLCIVKRVSVAGD